MRANELAGVAERVTNRATLLALNAALEATRSGSEAFASIAEETRRLAEYAREATDTISRLSNEIEDKVGETISSIQTSSEDAKAAVASSGDPRRVVGVAPETAGPFALLLRLRSLRGGPRPEWRTGGRPLALRSAVPAFESRGPTLDGERTRPRSVTFVEAAGCGAFAEAATPPSPLGTAAVLPPETHTAFGVSHPNGGAPPPRTATPSNRRRRWTDAGGHGELPAAAEPAPFVAPKIPDWLEGIEPRHRG
jgi:hypothetical protein